MPPWEDSPSLRRWRSLLMAAQFCAWISPRPLGRFECAQGQTETLTVPDGDAPLCPKRCHSLLKIWTYTFGLVRSWLYSYAGARVFFFPLHLNPNVYTSGPELCRIIQSHRLTTVPHTLSLCWLPRRQRSKVCEVEQRLGIIYYLFTS